MGGFGAVMGAKKLKAITVIGTGQVSLADRERLAEITKAVGNETRGAARRPPRDQGAQRAPGRRGQWRGARL